MKTIYDMTVSSSIINEMKVIVSIFSPYRCEKWKEIGVSVMCEIKEYL